jgi:hypothetical protein
MVRSRSNIQKESPGTDKNWRPAPDGPTGAIAVGASAARRRAWAAAPLETTKNVATTVSWSTLRGLYAAGFLEEREDWRRHALTGGEGAVVSMGLNEGR